MLLRWTATNKRSEKKIIENMVSHRLFSRFALVRKSLALRFFVRRVILHHKSSQMRIGKILRHITTCISISCTNKILCDEHLYFIYSRTFLFFYFLHIWGLPFSVSYFFVPFVSLLRHCHFPIVNRYIQGVHHSQHHRFNALSTSFIFYLQLKSDLI